MSKPPDSFLQASEDELSPFVLQRDGSDADLEATSTESWETGLEGEEQQNPDPSFGEDVGLEAGPVDEEEEALEEQIADEQSQLEELGEDETGARKSVPYPSGESLPIASGPDGSRGDEYWDPNHSPTRPGAPLVDTSATQAGISSGRVVSISMYSPADLVNRMR